MVWNAMTATTEYHVYRGILGTLSYGYYGACADVMDPVRTDTSVTDVGAPAAGQGLFYLITAQNAAGEEGTLGFGYAMEESNYTSCLNPLRGFGKKGTQARQTESALKEKVGTPGQEKRSGVPSLPQAVKQEDPKK